MPPASTSSAGRYVREGELGSGTYGVVYMARDRLTGGTVAIKRMNVTSEEEGVPATTIRELCLLKELHHPNIVSMSDVTFQAPKLTLVFEYCEYDLKKYMDTKRTRSLDIQTEVKGILKQLLLGLEHMHARHVVHRDLKPQNLLINSNLQLKIADFGLARVEGIPVKKYSHEAVTLWYRPPDVILGSTNYGFAVDIWSVGCIFAEMITGKPLFNGPNEAEQLLKMFRLLGSPTSSNFPNLSNYPSTRSVYQSAKDGALDEFYQGNFDEFVRTNDLHKLGDHGLDLLRRMLRFDPSQRITAAEALAHPFLANYEVQYLLPHSHRLADKSNGVANNQANGPEYTRQDPTVLVQMQAVLDAIDQATRLQLQQQQQDAVDMNYNSVTVENSSVLNASSRMVPIPPTNPKSNVGFAPQ